LRRHSNGIRFKPQASAFDGIKFHNLVALDKDVTVSYTMLSNQGWTAGEEDVLRGEKT